MRFVGSATYTNAQTITGTSSDPYNFLVDAIAKAYEIGAPYTSAEITINLMTGVQSGNPVDYHFVRPLATNERNYVPSKFDVQQTTKIIIQADTGAPTQTIYYKLRDRYTFNVGAGLTIKNVIFDAYESTFFPEHISDMVQDQDITKPILQNWNPPKDP